MDFNYVCDQTFKFKLIEKTKRPSLILRQHRIDFNFYFEVRFLNWVANLDSMSAEYIGEEGPYTIHKSAHVAVEKSLSYQETEEAIEEVLTSPPLSADQRKQLIRYAWKKYNETVWSKPFGGNTKTVLDFQVILEHDHLFPDPLQETCRMVPASDSSIQSLKKCGFDSWRIYTEDSSCCICLENFAADGGCEALCMPCEHVFHGDCIKEWLRTSHYCPLCRFEMPTS